MRGIGAFVRPSHPSTRPKRPVVPLRCLWKGVCLSSAHNRGYTRTTQWQWSSWTGTCVCVCVRARACMFVCLCLVCTRPFFLSLSLFSTSTCKILVMCVVSSAGHVNNSRFVTTARARATPKGAHTRTLLPAAHLHTTIIKKKFVRRQYAKGFVRFISGRPKGTTMAGARTLSGPVNGHAHGEGSRLWWRFSFIAHLPGSYWSLH